MSIAKDDPRRTAWALGEMDERERAAFEAELERDPEARADGEAIRALGKRLEGELAQAPGPRLDHDQRVRLAAATTRSKRGRARWIVLKTGAIAASVLVVLFVAVGLFVPRAQEASRMRPPGDRPGAERASRGATPLPVPESEPRPAPPMLRELISATPPREPPPPSGPPLRSASELLSRPLESGTVEEQVHGARPPFHTEGYDRIRDNPFVRVADRDHSTFSIDVDTASYANVRRFLYQEGRLPPKDAVRIEELINYFPYDYAPPAPDAEHPFVAHAAVAACPWEPSHRLVRVALEGKGMRQEERPPANLVFLLDVSGSMRPPNKLPLLKRAMLLLVDRLEARDRVAIVVYAGAAGCVLPSTACDEKPVIRAALDRLRSGGSTNGGAGIELAYRIAGENRIEGGVNRVILCTDGDFNVGISDRGSLTRLIEEKAKSAVFLTVLGFGMGNLKDDRMEELSNRGNGNYAYIDTFREARKVLVEEGMGTLVTIAKDVKIQVFFNPRKVEGWRLIGYENRLLRKEDFNDDTKDAGEIGAGHAVTALYEIVPAGEEMPVPSADENPFTSTPQAPEIGSDAVLRLRLRYKEPDGETSTLMEQDVFDEGRSFEDADTDFQWASAVAGFGMLLRDSPHKGQCTWGLVEEIAQVARGEDARGYRAECLQLMRLAAGLSDR